ncbi:hypothetical protein NDU88_000696 [Pleurodeles waltl]|uniref:Uncharacterized protein n=1 Tax=Pleurodeles waltl TaxID=8319 RepID=A0AAV7TG70_PLEWA|nr:hypothetical protein NDU88_000696 [Pleurodeles waltl]
MKRRWGHEWPAGCHGQERSSPGLGMSRNPIWGPGTDWAVRPLVSWKQRANVVGTSEWHRGLNTAARHKPEEDDRQFHCSGQERASDLFAPGEYCEVKLGSTWLNFEEQSAEEEEIRDEDDKGGEWQWWG